MVLKAEMFLNEWICIPLAVINWVAIINRFVRWCSGFLLRSDGFEGEMLAFFQTGWHFIESKNEMKKC